MNFYDRLQQETAAAREHLLAAPIFERVRQGQLTLGEYAAFLVQAFHHVKHTTPLLMTTGGKIGQDREWLRDAIAEYIEEELGHQEWILNDIVACGFDRAKARASQPDFHTELMVAYTYDSIQRISPLAFFGTVQVLEGTSINIASDMADAIQKQLGLPNEAFSYLRSHGALDQQHIVFFENLMNRITDPGEQQIIIHNANVYYRLYGNMFRDLNATQVEQLAA